MDVKKIEKAVSLFLEGLGEDPRREGLVKTPQRVAEMCREIFGGLATTPELQPAFSEKLGEDDAIEVRGIRFYSVCEHHLLPFFGKIDILYVPGNNRVAGFSDLLALVDGFARRPQIQERLTAQIADAVFQQLSPARHPSVHGDAGSS